MVWVFLAVFIIGTSLWSYYILLKQKRAWEGFAKKHGLQFNSQAMLKSPAIQGSFKGVPVVVCSDKPLAGKPNELTARTVIQFTLKAPMPSVGAVGSQAFRNFVGGLSLPEEFKPVFDGWNSDILIRAEQTEPLTPYFTHERLAALNALMGIKNCASLLIFSQDSTILRIETTEPFDEVERFEKFLSKAADAAKILSL